VKKYEVKAQIDDLKFEIAVNLLLNSENIHVIQCTKCEGPSEVFGKIQSELLFFINK
jgi:hypothetical protein